MAQILDHLRRDTRHQLTLDSFTCLWKLLFPEQITHVDAQHRKSMFSLSGLHFHLQKHRCSSGQSRQYLSPTLNFPYISVCDGRTGASGTRGDTSAKEEELVTQWLCPAGVVMSTVSPHCWDPQGKCSCQGELEPLKTQIVFSVTLILLLCSDPRQKPDTQLQTASSPKMV